MQLNTEQKIFYTLRLAVIMCFIGHGSFGIITKQIWCNYFAVFGIGQHTAYRLMPIVGSMDIIMGILMIVYPIRALPAWLVVWGLVTALLRPLSGEPFAEFVERAGNYGAPFALLLISGGISRKNIFTPVRIGFHREDKKFKQLIICLQIIVFLLLAGHGWLNLIEKKGLIDQYTALGFSNPYKAALVIGIFEIAAAFTVLIRPVRPLLFALFIWKMGSELFYPHYELFEWIERGGSYGALLALFFAVGAKSSVRFQSKLKWPDYAVKSTLLLMLLACCGCCLAQDAPKTDTIKPKELDSVLVTAFIKQGIAQPLPEVQDMYIYSGKKTTSFHLDGSKANLAGNMARMAFAQIPGLNVWEMDGAGTQVNIGSRGTDTHRSIEMNMRQNGYNTNSDIFGYPEDHYTPPMQAIREIQFVRGSAALQFGSQFGGMMNYIMKEGDSSKPFSLETEQTAGGYVFFNSFNAVGGTAGKLNYYAYYDSRHGDGWRPNASFNYHAYYANFNYHFSSRASLALQFSRMDYVQKIAGGLTDAQFEQNPRQSFRSRNFFNPEINIPALVFNYDLSSNTHLQVTAHALFGQRNSVQFINTPDIMDTVNKALGTYNPRQVDRDYYNGFTTEARILHHYHIGGISSTIAGGIRYFTETTKRRQKGTGTAASDFDLGLTKPYSIDLRFHTNNYAAFAENIFRIGSRFSITPGFRYEVINTDLSGVINNASFPVSYKGNRSFPLFGAGMQYQLSSSGQLYGNISQAYRPYLYANITPADQLGVIDPNLKDSKGYDIDLGYRGHYKDLVNVDLNLFYVYYGNRAGQLTLTNPDNSTYLYTTNIGNVVSKGAEAYLEASIWKLAGGNASRFDLRVFNSLAYTHARYTSGAISISGKNVSVKGNRAEGTPDWIDRTGLRLLFKGISTTLQYSYVSKNFSDANNTVFNPTGASGIVPAYHVWDWAFEWHFLQYYHFGAGVNNIANAHYFTRRINMYPGPGILPADGRTFYVSLGLKL